MKKYISILLTTFIFVTYVHISAAASATQLNRNAAQTLAIFYEKIPLLFLIGNRFLSGLLTNIRYTRHFIQFCTVLLYFNTVVDIYEFSWQIRLSDYQVHLIAINSTKSFVYSWQMAWVFAYWLARKTECFWHFLFL